MAAIFTKLGMMDETLLEKVPVTVATAKGIAYCTEWRYLGEVVKRDINFTPVTGSPPKGST